MAILNFIGFETGNSVELDALTGTASVQGTTVRSGSYALEVNPVTTATGYARVVGLSASGAPTNLNHANVYGSFWFRIATAPGSGSEEFFAVTNSTTPKLIGRINSDRTIGLYDTSGTTQLGSNGATVLALNTWYLIEFSCGTGASANYELRINGSTELSGTGDLFTSNAQHVRLGKWNNRNGQSVDFFYDDVWIGDSTWLGSCAIVALTPDSDGTYTAWTGTYSDVDEIPHDSDTSYISDATSGNAETVGLISSATAGISGTIPVIKSLAIVRDEGGASAIQVRLRSGSTNDDTSNNDPGSTYTARCKLYESDPSDAGAWTTTKLDSLEVGLENNASVAVRCTGLMVLVCYVPAAGQSGTPSEITESVVAGDLDWFGTISVVPGDISVPIDMLNEYGNEGPVAKTTRKWYVRVAIGGRVWSSDVVNIVSTVGGP